MLKKFSTKMLTQTNFNGTSTKYFSLYFMSSLHQTPFFSLSFFSIKNEGQDEGLRQQTSDRALDYHVLPPLPSLSSLRHSVEIKFPKDARRERIQREIIWAASTRNETLM